MRKLDVVLLVAAVVAVACGGGSSQPAQSITPSPDGGSPPPSPQPDAGPPPPPPPDAGPSEVTLSVSVFGPGDVNVVGYHHCYSSCSYQIPSGDTVRLLAEPDDLLHGSQEWGGACGAYTTFDC